MKKGIGVEKKRKRSSISTKLSMILGIASVLVFLAMSVAIIKTGEHSISSALDNNLNDKATMAIGDLQQVISRLESISMTLENGIHSMHSQHDGIGQAPEKGSVLSFLVGDIHPYDLGMILDRLGIAIRTGHHCAEPLMHVLGVEGTARASFALYNTKAEVDALAEGIERAQKMF
mgnify:CR=1 FL=1